MSPAPITKHSNVARSPFDWVAKQIVNFKELGELIAGEFGELGVVLGPTFKRVGQKDGCWPGQQGSDKSDNEGDLSTESEADVVEGGC
jgi:hypothetical protein